jgi:putative SOS response-associated peptidase YedK
MPAKERSMCGRFLLYDSIAVLSKDFDAPIRFDLTPHYNIAPSQRIAAVRSRPNAGSKASSEREFVLLRWGLIPSWAKDASIGNRLINARAETVAEKPAFKNALKHRRCLVPASGFYEWQKLDRRKQPYCIRMRDRRPIAFAGLWERWKGPDDVAVESCTLITTEANELVSPIHNRMPVIIQPADHGLWLSPEMPDRERLAPLLRPYSANEMEAFPIGNSVNNPSIDNASILDVLDG